MAININADSINLYDESSFIRNNYDGSSSGSSNIDFERINAELASIKRRLDQNSIDYQIVQRLESASKKRDWSSITNMIRSFAEQFPSALLANLAGAYLSARFHLL